MSVFPHPRCSDGGFLHRLQTVYRERGPGELFEALLRRLTFKRISTNSAMWYTRDLTCPAEPMCTPPAIPVSAEFCSFAETLAWIRSLKQAWMLNSAEQAIAEEERHYWGSAKTPQGIIGYLKIGTGRVYINDYARALPIPEGVAFIYDTFVLPEFRNGNVATHLIQEGCRFLRTRGFSRLLCHIPAWNKASAKAYAKVGFVPARRVRCFRIFHFSCLTSDPMHL